MDTPKEPAYKQAQREAEAASRRVYRPQPTKQGFVRDQDGAVYVFAGKQARVIKPRLTGRAARWLRRIMERVKASLERADVLHGDGSGQALPPFDPSAVAPSACEAEAEA